MNYQELSQTSFFWTLQGLCALHRKPFSLELAQQQCAAPYSNQSLQSALDQVGLLSTVHKCSAKKLYKESFPLVAWCREPINVEIAISSDVNSNDNSSFVSPALVLQADEHNVLIVEHSDSAPQTISLEHFQQRYTGQITRVTPKIDPGIDADSAEQERQARPFGFSWFVPELLKHKKLWQEILLASLVIQLIALATPLFTQAIIDKVVVHRTQSTLIVIAIGMLVFMIFSAGLSWLRQYLVLHTGNRVDAVLGSAVFERLFKLPPLYFQHRSTGVISARMHGVETIREFIASAAVTIILDLPFLLIFVAIMFYYSVTLTLIVLAILTVIVVLSAIVAPMFQTKLQQQFQLGARNQAFMTEYIVGLETVKSLQLEPQLNSKYSGYLASYLQAGFDTKQLANTYNTVSNLLEQIMTLLILAIGAYTVMHSTEFTIGMLVAFQMFSGRLSQPMLRLVGLWQQFQQARLSVDRLGDLMNAPTEPYSMVPSRDGKKNGKVQIEQIAFKYAEELPLVYDNLSLTVEPGQTIGIMGPSGCGKSTLAKLLQGFYQPTAGRILVDGVDIRYLSANELRAHFGVVPQETTLFSGTIYDNLQMASPDATFEQIAAACKMAEIHQTIEALPKGYQTEIGERGAGLSGGQKQRIAIARALLKRPSILVFDEATSALDTNTAEHFAQTINSLRGKVTMLFITHGLPKGLHVDAVYRLGAQGAQKVALAPAVSSNT
ncbi:peptidase domain-containing ABC transporter [Undibacterium amnicola]|uniref:Peptidase domain-containing ABC transporter n=1 Tax=Undibacterium amnicola TaxID=1834038 RepID=A0ABR6XL64_9BURK|nr:peptidase domain-containing ABC transporter [Undibacterium amnicola]MBC3830267.1 peptidase domain-containing ABC transporter [Undibacterium amnicola]